jgi:hypothetical protein
MEKDLKKEALEKFAKKLSIGDYSSGNLVMPNKSLGSQALEARNIAEQALANEFLKNTGLPIPDKFTSVSKAEDFLNSSLQEAYPEFDPNVKLLSEKNDPYLKGNLGFYSPKKSEIVLNRDSFSPKDIRNLLATTFHEGAHKYDDKVLKYQLPKDLSSKNGMLNFEDAYKTAKELDRPIDPTEMYEIAAKGHHARIPKLRDADSFGLGALKSYLKSGTFKAIPIVGTAAAGAAALSSPDASAAAMDMAIPGGLESLGPSAEDMAIENPQKNPAARRAALEKLMGR